MALDDLGAAHQVLEALAARHQHVRRRVRTRRRPQASSAQQPEQLHLGGCRVDAGHTCEGEDLELEGPGRAEGSRQAASQLPEHLAPAGPGWRRG